MRWAADTCVASARYDAKSRNSIRLRRFEFDEFVAEYASHGEVPSVLAVCGTPRKVCSHRHVGAGLLAAGPRRLCRNR
jgi:hypothetical protein